ACVAWAAPARAQGSFAPTGSMTVARDLQTATPLADGTVLIAGGEDEMHVFGAWNTAETFDPATGTFTATANTMSSERAEATATLLADGKVLIAGGWYMACCQSGGSYGQQPVATADVYDPATRTFTQVGSLATARYEAAAVRLADGRVLIAGGFTNINYGSGPTSSAEIYDPTTQTFSSAGSMTQARNAETMILLPSGKVLIVGGGGTAAQQTAELFDPTTGTFTATANPPVQAESGARAFMLPDGTVLLIGSGTGTEIYDPATDSFTAGAPTLANHDYWAAIVQLTSGKILLAGNGSAEVYDPSTGTSVSVGNPGVGSLFPAGAPLSNGRALITGGETFVPYTFVATSAATIFTPNSPPVADPGANQTVSAGAGCVANVTLDGSASSDPDGDALTYSWAEGTTPLGTGAVINVSLGVGTHVISLTVDDGHGGTDTKTVTITVADTAPPSFTVPPPVTLEQAGPNGTLYTPVIPVATDYCNATPQVTVSGVPAGSIFPAGVTTLTYSASDTNGNTASATTTVTVHDTTPPALTLPGSLVAEATGPSGATVAYTVSATDAVTAHPAVSCTPVSGSVFPLGQTTVQCTATDAAGNIGSGSFTVTVHDTTPPALTLPGSLVAEATSPAGTPVAYTVSATDAVTPNPVIACSPASGSVFPLGQTTVQCTATDAAGNVASGAFTVTVRDTIPPTIVITSPTGTTYGLMQTVASAYTCADTGSGVATCAGPVPSGSPLDTSTPGAHTFTVTATDVAGNASTASVTYTVVGLHGRMDGQGAILQNGARHRFEFRVADDGDAGRDDGGRLRIWTGEARGGDHDVDRDRDHRGRGDDGHGNADDVALGFSSTKVTSVGFWSDAATGGSRRGRQVANQVVFSGTGRWNGMAGYTFTARASDADRRGAADAFQVTVYDPSGAVVLTLNGPVREGEIEALPAGRR
ncbi:MAG TPA: HYR domain-containing protein, partial [Vicinamibacterales bacterium]|nr:HYR domain-containing protein [Vicinamibacterales bacterium]